MNALFTWLKEPVFGPPAAPPPPAPPPPPVPGPMPPAPPAATGTLKLEDVIRGVVAAVATAVSVVGLLTVVGGAVTWLRFSQLGLPTQTGLSVTPKADLIALGATGLVIYVGLAILLVAFLYAVDPHGVVTGATLTAVVLLAIGAVVYIVRFGDFEGRSQRLLVIAVAVLAAASVRIGPATSNRFVPFGVALFFAVLLFGAAVTYRLESDNPKVQPAAVLQGKQRTALVGFFVAANDDRIYIARLTRGGRPGALYDLERGDTTRLAVGRRMPCDSGRGVNVQCKAAATVAVALRKQLLSDRRKVTPAVKKAKKKKKPKA